MKKEENALGIASVKLNSGGAKGLIVNHTKVRVTNGREILDEFPGVKYKSPVAYDILGLFSDLGNYLLDICCYTTAEMERKILLNELEVTGVTCDASGFVLTGKLRVLGGGKVISLNTPLIKESDSYEGYDEVMKIIDKIYAEAVEHINGKTMADDDLVRKFYTKDDQTKIDFETMGADERKAVATKLLEELGSVVIHRDEVKSEEQIAEDKEVGTVIQMNVPVAEVENEEEMSFDLPHVAEQESTAKKVKVS